MVLKPKKPMAAEAAYARLEDLCARGEHCRYELAEKLRRWLVPADVAEKILSRLHEVRYYDDSRFASAYARDKALYARWGKRKIAMGLRAKRISADIVSTALDEIDETEYRDIMLDLLTAKARTLKEGNTFEGRTKLYRFGITRGYEPALVAAAIRSGVLFDESDD